jgi:hypothetical protein
MRQLQKRSIDPRAVNIPCPVIDRSYRGSWHWPMDADISDYGDGRLENHPHDSGDRAPNNSRGNERARKAKHFAQSRTFPHISPLWLESTLNGCRRSVSQEWIRQTLTVKKDNRWARVARKSGVLWSSKSEADKSIHSQNYHSTDIRIEIVVSWDT